MTEAVFDHEAFARDVEQRFSEILRRLTVPDDRPLYSPAGLAERLNISTRVVADMIRDGTIASFKVGGSRRISAAAVDEYLARQAASDV